MSRRFNVTCRECSFTDDHAEWCQSRGYASVGPHPDAPAPDTARSPADPPALQEMCCGGSCVRAVCVYHGPKARAKAPALVRYWVDGEYHGSSYGVGGVRFSEDPVIISRFEAARRLADAVDRVRVARVRTD